MYICKVIHIQDQIISRSTSELEVYLFYLCSCIVIIKLFYFYIICNIPRHKIYKIKITMKYYISSLRFLYKIFAIMILLTSTCSFYT